MSPARQDASTRARRRFLRESGWFDHDWYSARTAATFGSPDDALRHFLASSGGIAPNPALAALQAATQARPSTDAHDDVPSEDDPQLRREVALVASSGLFDADFYRAVNPDMRHSRDPLLHYCRVGWREGRQPSADFDTWHYWSTHLTPEVEGVNPLVHHILVGQPAGWSTKAGWRPALPGADLRGPRPVRRACLFAGYDANGRIDETLVGYVRELARHADVYFLADSYIEDTELEKLAEVTTAAWAIPQGAYDFGSWSTLARDLVGWEALETYDEVLFVNDSCYLLKPLDEVFEQMDRSVCDWWGLQATKGVARTAEPVQDVTVAPIPLSHVRDHLLEQFAAEPEYDFLVGSYFLAFRGPVITDSGFRRLLDSVCRQRSKRAIVHKYEIGLTNYLISQGHSFDTFVDSLYPFQPVFTNQYFRLLERGFPLLKKYFLYENHYDTPDLENWKERITAVVPGAPVDVIEQNLLRTAPDDRLRRSFSIVTQPDGSVHVPCLLSREEFHEADRLVPTFDHWWAFLVSPDGELSASCRAVFEEVHDDPSLKKIVLTRSLRLGLSGENVVVVPLQSPEGQRLLLRSGVVLVPGRTEETLPWPLNHRHRVIALPSGVAAERRSPARFDVRPVRRAPTSRLQAFVASSAVDCVAAASHHYPVHYDLGWVSGLPANDFLVMPTNRLPDEILAEQQQIEELLGRRRLVAFLPTRDPRAADCLTPDELDWLRSWCRQHDAVVGVREDPHSRDRATWRALRGQAIDLSHDRFRHTVAVLRSAAALVTGRPGVALDFTITGRPVVPFLPGAPDERDTSYFALDQMMPAPVCRDTAQLRRAFDELLSPPEPPDDHHYRRVRDLFHEHLDHHSAARVVRRVRELVLQDAG